MAAPQLYLMTPPDAEPARFERVLMATLSGPQVAALLVRRGTQDDEAYAVLAARLVEIGQAAGAAVLVEDDSALAGRIGADGVHVTQGGTEAIRAASAALKPDGIVGVGNIRSRHDAMSFGELDVDYLLFGALDGDPDPQAVELAQWWAETFEVPAILSNPAADPAQALASTAEFVGLGDAIWRAENPAAALAAFARALGERA